MSDPSLMEIMDALADQIQTGIGTVMPGIQIVGRRQSNATGLCVDIYPGDPFQEQTGFALASRELNFTVRARVNTADNKGAQDELLALMDPRADSSLAAAIVSDRTLGGTVDQLQVTDGPTGFGQYPDSGPDMLGCQWNARVVI